MHSIISGPTVSQQPLQFDAVSPAAAFPRVARISARSADDAGGSFGTLLRRVELPASVLTSTVYAPRISLSQHAHASAFVLFVRHGSFVQRHGWRSECLERSTCIYRPACDEHADDFDASGAVLTAMDLSPALVDRLREAGFDGQRFSVRSPFVQQFGDRLDAELARPDAMSQMIVEALATDVIAFASRRGRQGSAARSQWQERARRFIEDQFASPLTLAAIAAAVGVHPVHLARQFRASHGCTVGEYIRRLRVAFARQQLVATDLPIAAIALAAGFCDQSQLSKTFKRVTGQTPAACRAQHR
ncbi:MAG: AraC family transcriptional regulator [Acidobacteriota bacterium]